MKTSLLNQEGDKDKDKDKDSVIEMPMEYIDIKVIVMKGNYNCNRIRLKFINS